MARRHGAGTRSPYSIPLNLDCVTPRIYRGLEGNLLSVTSIVGKLLPTLAVYTMQSPAEVHICDLRVHNRIPELPVAPRLPPSLICLSTLTGRSVTTLVESVESDASRGTSNTIVDRGPTLASREVTGPLSPKSSNRTVD